jgi:molybdopterin synthase catalytic subunit
MGSYLTTAPLDERKLTEAVRRASDGAVVLFAGIVRDHHDGRSVESIHYEAYEPMAEQEIETIVSSVRERYPEVAVGVQHRLGLVKVGEASVAIACSSAHRAVAFAACREIIDRMKETVPIWKKEKSPEGEVWVGWQGA